MQKELFARIVLPEGGDASCHYILTQSLSANDTYRRHQGESSFMKIVLFRVIIGVEESKQASWSNPSVSLEIITVRQGSSFPGAGMETWRNCTYFKLLFDTDHEEVQTTIRGR